MCDANLPALLTAAPSFQARLNALRSIGFAIAFGHPLRLGGGRAARAGRAPELSRSPDAGLDEVLGDARHPGHRPRGELGAILALFKWVYAFLSPIGGYLADRHSRRHVIAGSLFVWSLVTWTTGHVTTYEQLLVTRALMGISEAFYIPAALALIADFHTGPTRSRAVGLHQMGIYVGVIIGGFGGYAADHPDLGWRWAFSLCGLIGIVYALPLFLMLRNPGRPADAPGRGRRRPARCGSSSATDRSFSWCSTSRFGAGRMDRA